MLTIPYLRNNTEDAIKRLAKKHVDAKKTIEEILNLDSDRRQTQTALDQALAQSNQLAKEIGQLFSQGKKEEAEAKKSQTSQQKENIKKMEDRLRDLEKQQHDLLVYLPNVPSDNVPEGKTPEDNALIRAG